MHSKSETDVILIKGVVGEYISNASHDNFADNSFGSYNAVQILLSEPHQFKNKQLTVFLEQEKENPIWKKKGSIVSFSLNKSLLDSDLKVFDGALENIKLEN